MLSGISTSRLAWHPRKASLPYDGPTYGATRSANGGGITAYSSSGRLAGIAPGPSIGDDHTGAVTAIDQPEPVVLPPYS